MKPVEIAIEAWWVVQAGYITEDDIKVEILIGQNLRKKKN